MNFPGFLIGVVGFDSIDSVLMDGEVGDCVRIGGDDVGGVDTRGGTRGLGDKADALLDVEVDGFLFYLNGKLIAICMFVNIV